MCGCSKVWAEEGEQLARHCTLKGGLGEVSTERGKGTERDYLASQPCCQQLYPTPQTPPWFCVRGLSITRCQELFLEELLHVYFPLCNPEHTNHSTALIICWAQPSFQASFPSSKPFSE